MTARSIERLLQTAPVVLAFTIGMALVWPLSAAPDHKGSPAAAGQAAAVQGLTNGLATKAGAGDFDAQAAYDSFVKAGLSNNEANAKTDEIRDIYQKFKKANHKDDPAVQHGDWDLGQV